MNNIVDLKTQNSSMKKITPKTAVNTQTQESTKRSNKFNFDLDKFKEIDISKIIKNKEKNDEKNEKFSNNDEAFRTPMKDEGIQTLNEVLRTPEVRMGKLIANIMI
jgi:plasmid rolling circle replication initiator protein Rep